MGDGDVVALLDFEFAMLGPAEIDLCRLVWDGLVSEDGTTTDPQAGAAAFDIAARQMDPIHGRALIHGAAVLDQLRDLDIWLARGRTEERFEDWRRTGCSLAFSTRKAVTSHPCSRDEIRPYAAPIWRTNPSSRA